MDARSAENTKEATNTWLTCLNDYLKEKNIAQLIKDVEDTDLPEVLFKFFSEVQTKKIDPEKPDSDTYASTTLRCIRAGVNVRFVKTNKLFQGMQKIGRKKGKGVIKHKKIIEAEDLQHLNDYFSRHMQPSSVILQ